MNERHRRLLFGDIISLECVELTPRHYMSSEGFVDASVACQPLQVFKDDEDFSNTLFQVITPCNYTAQSKITLQMAKIAKVNGFL